MKGQLCAAITALLIGLTTTAHAQQEAAEPTPAQVRAAADAFDRGREAYRAEEFVSAAEQFEIADANAPRASTLELAIRSRDKAGQLDRAASLAALALQRYPDDANLARVAKPLVERAKAELYEVTVRCSSACDLVVGGKLVHGARVTDHTLYVQPGKRVIRAGFDDNRSASKTVEAAKGEATVLDFEAPALPTSTEAEPVTPEDDPDPVPTEPVQQEPSSGWTPAVFWTGLGLTGVAAGVTIWSGIDTQNNPGPEKVKEACVGQDESCPEYQEGLGNQRRTNILIGVTSAVGVATILIGALATDWSGANEEAVVSRSKTRPKNNAHAVRIQPFVGFENGATVGAFGRF